MENAWDQAYGHVVVRTAVELGTFHVVDGVVAFEVKLTHLDATSKPV